jgi:PAS domain S-box-containing protein
MQSKPAVGRFRALVEHSADAIWLLAESGGILYASPASQSVLGYSPDELTGANAFDFFLPSDRAAARARLLESRGDSPTFRMRRKDGAVVWVDAIGANRLAEPEIEGVIVSLRDVSEARRADQLLRDSESRFRALVESSLDGFVLLDRDARVLETGPPVLGYEVGSLVGRNVLELIHPEDLDAFCGNLATVSGGPGRRAEGEHRIQHRDGAWRWVEVRMRNLVAIPAVGGIVVNYRDVTARKANEEELRRTRDQVRQILESIQESFIALDREWRFTYVNRLVADAIGKTTAEVIGKNIWDEFPEARNTEFYPQYRRVMTERIPVQFEMYYPPNGRWFDVHAYPTDDGLAAYILNITERKRAERLAAIQHEVTRALVESEGLPEIAGRVLRAIREGLAWPGATFWKVDAERGILRPWRVKTGRTIAKGKGAAGVAWESGRASWQSGALAFAVRRGAETVGVMEFSNPDAREADAALLGLMDGISEQIAMVLERQARA